MAEKKKTEIVIGFTQHLPSFVDKELANMRKADVILFEYTTHGIEFLKRGGITPHMLAQKSYFPDSAERIYRGLKELSDEGKTVLGYEDRHNPQIWSNKERAKLSDLEEDIQYAFKSRRQFKGRNFLKSAEALAEATRLRDDKTLKWIKDNLPRFEGKKIYISAGSLHTPLYHALKRELESKGIPVKAIFLAKGRYKDARALEKYTPYHQMSRAILFNTPSSRSKKGLKRHVKETNRYMKRALVISKKYGGLPPGAAQERIDSELMNTGKKGLLQRLRRKR